MIVIVSVLNSRGQVLNKWVKRLRKLLKVGEGGKGETESKLLRISGKVFGPWVTFEGHRCLPSRCPSTSRVYSNFFFTSCLVEWTKNVTSMPWNILQGNILFEGLIITIIMVVILMKTREAKQGEEINLKESGSMYILSSKLKWM